MQSQCELQTITNSQCLLNENPGLDEIRLDLYAAIDCTVRETCGEVYMGPSSGKGRKEE
jgi:hypothetical protein